MPLQVPSAPPDFSDAIVSSAPGGPANTQPLLSSSQVLRANSTTPLAVQKLIVGIGWDCKQDEKGQSLAIDLDASVICFDAQGQYLDCIYFGNLCNGNKSIVHAGDNRTGAGDGDDEEIVLQLDAIPPQIGIMVVVINSYSGDTFATVNSAFVRIINADRGRDIEMGRFSLSASGNYTAMIMGKFYRNASNQWQFHTMGKGTHGRSFGDILPLVQQELRDLIPHIRIQPANTIVVMTKGESVPVVTKDNAIVSQIMVGLGWDMIGDSPVDLDASCVMFSDTNQMDDVVYFNHLTSKCGSIRHQGDNRSGAGDGDDEKIYVDLYRIPSNIQSLFIIVNCFSAHKFALIKNAYVRICECRDPNRPVEIMRFSLSTASGPVSDSTAMIMCKLYRQGNRWMCKALGYGTQGRTFNENVPEMQKELAGRNYMSSHQTHTHVLINAGIMCGLLNVHVDLLYALAVGLPIQPNGFQWVPPPASAPGRAPGAPPANSQVCCIIS